MDNDFTRQTEADAMFDGAIIAYRQKKYAKAFLLFKRLLNSFNDFICEWNVYQWIGSCYLKQGKYELAIKNLLIADKGVDCIESGKFCFHIADDLGFCYAKVGDYSNSIVYYEKAEKFLHFHLSKEMTTDRYLYFRGKGRTYSQLEKHELALSEFNRCKTLLETDEDATTIDWAITNFEIARELTSLGNIQESLKILETVDFSDLSTDEKDEYFYMLADVYHRNRDYLKAIAFLNKIDLNEIDESFLCNIHFIKGASLYHLSRYTESEESFVKAKELVDDEAMERSIVGFLEDLDSKI